MNTMRGAVTFEADGETLTLVLTTNAMVRYEDAHEVYRASRISMGLADPGHETFLQAVGKMENEPSVMHRLRRVIWAGLSHIPDMTEDRAGDIADAVGLMEMAKLVGQAVTLAYPEPEAKPGNVPPAKSRAKPKT